MYVTVMVGKFVTQDVREWCPSTTGPLLPTMTDSLCTWLGPSPRCLSRIGLPLLPFLAPSLGSMFNFSA